MYPKYLYHYTSVDTLELILKNRTIRFNTLDKMDDPEEQESKHGNQHGRTVFISSWTASVDEIPEMWKQYCRPNPSVGVRIKLPINPFSMSKNTFESNFDINMGIIIYLKEKLIEEKLGINLTDDLFENLKYHNEFSKKFPKEALEFSEMSKALMRNTPIYNHNDINNMLIKVEYTNDKDLLFPWIYGSYKGNQFEMLDKFGKYKNPTWEWQKEWRYILHIRNAMPGIIHNDGSIELYQLPFSHYDLYLDDNKIQEMEITLSPCISLEARNKVNNIVNSYLPTANVVDSSLKIL